VKGWSWPAEQVQAIPPFYRYHVRVEMRCSTAFERPSIGDGLDGVLEQWLSSKGVTVAPEPAGQQAAALAGQRAELVSTMAQSPNSLRTLERGGTAHLDAHVIAIEWRNRLDLLGRP
jgi:hypothetical protein